MPNVTIIVAVDINHAIGKDGDIPWRGKLRSDMDHFAKTTKGRIVVMGDKTYKSLPERFRPLPDRMNVVLTKDPTFRAAGCNVMYSIDEVFSAYGNQEIFVAGGGEIYRLFMPYANRLLVTYVNTTVDRADTFFPEITGEWHRRIVLTQEVDTRNLFSFFVTEFTKTVP
ncbi:MAG: dihydrofolate reductase [Thermoplasmatota archaeon]